MLEWAQFGWRNGLIIRPSTVLAIYFQTSRLVCSSTTQPRLSPRTKEKVSTTTNAKPSLLLRNKMFSQSIHLMTILKNFRKKSPYLSTLSLISSLAMLNKVLLINMLKRMERQQMRLGPKSLLDQYMSRNGWGQGMQLCLDSATK